MWRNVVGVVVVLLFLYGFHRQARAGDSFLRALFWEITSIWDLKLDDRKRTDDRRPFDREA